MMMLVRITIIICLITGHNLLLAKNSIDYNPLEKALSIAIANSSAIQEQQNILNIVRRQKSSNWDVKVKVRSAWSQESTYENESDSERLQQFAPGIDTRPTVTFSYTPTWGYPTKDDKAKAEAKRKVGDEKFNIRTDFMNDTHQLSMLDVEYTITEHEYTIRRQALKRVSSMLYLPKKNEKDENEKRIIRPSLSDEEVTVLKEEFIKSIRNVQTQYQVTKKAEHSYKARLRFVSRKWGYKDWRRLEQHIINYITSLRDINLAQYNN